MTIKAIETRYKGYKFRSRLEARYAVFFDSLGLEWTYEQEGFDMDGVCYLPDFFITERFTFNGDGKEHKRHFFLEVKPSDSLHSPTSLPIYLAGKMSDWRVKLFLNGHHSCGPDETFKHDRGLHGDGCSGDHRATILGNCLSAIENSGCVFAWIDCIDCYGAIAEIGFARGLGKPVFVGFSEEVIEQVKNGANCQYKYSFDIETNEGHEESSDHDLWFIEDMASKSTIQKSPQEAFDFFFGTLDEEEKKCLALSKKHPVILAHGDPLENKFTVFSWGKKVERLAELPFINRNSRLFEKAAIAARSARFEHGQSGAC